MLNYYFFLLFIINFFYIVPINTQQTISFVKPLHNDTHFDDTAVIVLLSYSSNVNGVVSQSCGNDSFVFHDVTTNIEKSFDLPTGYIGLCFYTAAFTGYPPVDSVNIFINGRINIITPVDSNPSLIVPAGSSTPVLLSYSPLTTPNKFFTVWLDCAIPGVVPAKQMIEAGIPDQSFHVPSDFYGSVCTLYVSDPDERYQSSTTIALTVTQQLFIEFPTENEVIIIPNAIPLKLRTGDANINVSIDVGVACPANLVGSINSYYTNVLYNYDYSINYFGACIVIVDPTSLPPYLLQPPVRFFSLKYFLKFKIHPSYIVLNDPFLIEMTSSTPINPSLTSIQLKLVCSDTPIYNWPIVALNELNTLVYNTPSNVAKVNCAFSTPANNLIFVQTVVPVSLLSPFGGNLFRISNAELAIYLQSIAFAPSSEMKMKQLTK